MGKGSREKTGDKETATRVEVLGAREDQTETSGDRGG